MITDEEIDEIGFALERGGLSHSEIDVYLEHYGVQGMKWGTRRQQNKAARQKNRALNKASRAKDTKKYDTDIDAARDYLKSGAAARDRAAAKEQYHKDKVKKGSREAKKILYEQRNKIYEKEVIAQQAKSGKETTVAVLAGIGAIGIMALAGGNR